MRNALEVALPLSHLCRQPRYLQHLYHNCLHYCGEAWVLLDAPENIHPMDDSISMNQHVFSWCLL